MARMGGRNRVREAKARVNTQLVEYGIQNEGSEMRAHVCFVAKRIYLYPTQSGIEAILTGRFPTAPAYQKDPETSTKIQTAEGYLVPPHKIRQCREVEIPRKLLLSFNVKESDSETCKGNAAVEIVMFMLKTGRLPIFCDPEMVEDLDLQRNGEDILIRNLNMRIQVKCDYKGGPKQRGGTGNLYLQVKECNPFGKH